MHIATVFQLIGYRHVVETLWPVADRACRHVAGDFYGHLGPSLDTEAAARALHQAVRALRADYPARPSWWAAHIHIGG